MNQALIKRLEDDQHEVGQLKRDLAAERKSRNNFQVEAERYESAVQRLEQKIVSYHIRSLLGHDANHNEERRILYIRAYRR